MAERGIKQEIGQLIKPYKRDNLIFKYVGERYIYGKIAYIYVQHSGRCPECMLRVLRPLPDNLCKKINIPLNSIPFVDFLIDTSDEKE